MIPCPSFLDVVDLQLVRPQNVADGAHQSPHALDLRAERREIVDVLEVGGAAERRDGASILQT